MSRKGYHCHSTFSDGKNSAEEMVQTAIRLGMEEIGLSDHSYTFFDESYCIPKARLAEYKAEVERLKTAYAGKIRVLCGIEQDYYSEAPTTDYEYVIGSVHYVRVGEEYIPVDESAEVLREATERLFGGDFYAFCEAYFETIGAVVEKTGCSIIGHFDLVAKYNEREHLYDPSHPRYIAAWQKAVDRILPSGALFEINTGGMARGYTTEPYPAADIRTYIAAHGGHFILSDDAHRAENLCYGFEQFAEEAK